MILTFIDTVVCAVAVASLLLIHHGQRKRRFRLPPGPKGLPIIGNVLDIPETKQWLTYAQWSKDYGSPVIYLNVLGQDIIVINDYETAQEALDKRSDRYSSRPRMPMLLEALSLDWVFSLIPIGEKWRACRRQFDIRFRRVAANQFKPHETRMTLQLLEKMLDSPKNFAQHFQYMAGSFILDFAYGIKVEPENDKYMNIVTHGLEGIEKAGDKNIIDIFPWMRHVPSWLPGMGWKKQIDLYKNDLIAAYDAPFEYTKESLENGTARPSLATDLLSTVEDRPSNPGWKEDIIKSICATAFLAGSDTTVVSLKTLTLVVMLYPEIQRKAQEQIDRVIGPLRLPGFADQSKLPYITAIVKEVLRYHAVLPFALPHSNTQDDVLCGYYVPKNTTILANTWAILQDPNVYPEPQIFKPERFLTSDGNLDPTVRSPDAVFGFGRRICPGRFTALDTLWITTACLLATFDFTKPKGLDIELSPDLFISGLVSHPHPFECIITPRNKEVAELIHSSLVASEDP